MCSSQGVLLSIQIANKLVCQSLTWDLFQDVLTVVVSECTAQFLVSHVFPVFLSSPQACQAIVVNEPKHSFGLVFPHDVLVVFF